jgi:hypothetical protein
VSLLDRVRGWFSRSADEDDPSAGRTTEDARIDALTTAAMHNPAHNPDVPGGGLPPPGYVAGSDEGRPRT